MGRLAAVPRADRGRIQDGWRPSCLAVDVEMQDDVMSNWGQSDRGPGFNASTCPHTCRAIIGYPDTLDMLGLGLGRQDGPFRWIFVQAPDGKVVTITIDTGRSGSTSLP